MARIRSSTALAALFATVLGCSEEEPPSCTSIDGQCVGLPAEAVCGDDTCAAGVPCQRVLTAGNDAELASTLMQAGAGDCVALAPGAYAGLVVPGGVSLLGRSAGEVRIGALTLESGSGAWLRGLTVEGGVNAQSATNVRIEAVLITGGVDSLQLDAGASVTVALSQIEKASAHGVHARGAASVTLEHSIVTDAEGPGVWVQCAEASCACAQKPVVALDHVLLSRNSRVSVNLIGAIGTLRHVHILDTQQGAGFAPGGGLAVSGCSDLGYGSLRVEGARSFGVLIDSSSARPLGSGLEEKGIIVVDGMPGIWVQSTGTEDPQQQVVLDGVDVHDCKGAGLGFDRGAFGIIVVDGKVANTTLVELPVEPSQLGYRAMVGIGTVWKAASSVEIQKLEISSSAGPGLVIDGPVGPN
ncbi:MAG TPA: right-handed parallel beta-helix repeat-containing protein, partial [Polyangiaceae bacterium]|nr:right-handed parallel beta-helix repeat-containing protein [Polyangiaceae bacterium]